MSSLLEPVQDNLERVRRRIAAAERAAGRPAGSVTLLAVTKTFPADAVIAAAAAGQRRFGENYLQEAEAKIAEVGQRLGPGLVEWHFIGPVQANKTRAIATHFDWVHTIDRLRVAERLSAQRPAGLPDLNVLVQVNVSGEATKGGVASDELEPLAVAVAALPRLRLRGLMAIPAPQADPARQRPPLARLRELQSTLSARLAAAGVVLDTLSMGMSADLEAAVAEGSTLVRVGTAIFGERS